MTGYRGDTGEEIGGAASGRSAAAPVSVATMPAVRMKVVDEHEAGVQEPRVLFEPYLRR